MAQRLGLTKLRKISLNACNYVFYSPLQRWIKYISIKITAFVNLPQLQHCSDGSAVDVVNAALFTAVSEDSKETLYP